LCRDNGNVWKHKPLLSPGTLACIKIFADEHFLGALRLFYLRISVNPNADALFEAKVKKLIGLICVAPELVLFVGVVTVCIFRWLPICWTHLGYLRKK